MFGEMHLAEGVSAQATTTMFVYQHLEIERAACPQIDMQLVRDFVPCAPLSIEEIITLGAPAPAPPAAGRQHEARRRCRVRQHSGCIGLSDQARRATQRRLKPPEWQQAQSQQEASRSTPKSDRPLNSARFLNLAVATLVLTPRSRQRLQCRLPCRLVAVGWRATFKILGCPHPLPRL